MFTSLLLLALSPAIAAGGIPLTVFGDLYVIPPNDYYQDFLRTSPQLAYQEGIQSFTEVAYYVSPSEWDNVTASVTSHVGAVNGTMMEMTFYTADPTPVSYLNLTNVKGVTYHFIRLGVPHTRTYIKNSAGVFVEDMNLRSEIVGPSTCQATAVLQAHTLGDTLPTNSVAYTLRTTSTISPGVSFNAQVDHTSEAYLFWTFPILTQESKDGGPPRGQGVPDDEPDDCSHNDFGTFCVDQVSTPHSNCESVWLGGTKGSEMRCVASTPWCPFLRMADEGLVSGTSAPLLYQFRDRLRAYPSARKYVASYILYGMYSNPTDDSLISPYMPEIVAAANTVVNGPASTVVVTPQLKKDVITIAEYPRGENSYLDLAINDFEAKVNATLGMTRSQFCTYMVSDADCTP